MTTAKDPKPVAARAARPLPLHTILSALSSEFTRAAAGHDATMTAWAEVYANAKLFEGRSPTGMKLVSVKVSLPVAIAQVVPSAPVIGRLTTARLTDALGPSIAKGTRQQVALEVCKELTLKDQDRLNDASLAKNVGRLLKEKFPELGVEHAALTARLKSLQRERKVMTEQPPEAHVTYRNVDLQSVSPDHIVKLDLDFQLE